jgi:hypothetical protein
LVVFEAALVDLEVVEEIDELPVAGIEVPQRVEEDDLMTGHWDAMLDVSGQFLVGDHEDDDLEALG